MEAVVAPWEHAHLLAVVQLAETDDSFISVRDAGFGLIHHHRYTPHQLPLLHRPGIRRRSHGGGGVPCGHGRRAGAAAVEPEAADERVEAYGADEDTEHRGEDDDHVGVEANVAPASGWRLQDTAGARRGRWRDEQRRRGCIDGGGGVIIVSEHAHADAQALASVPGWHAETVGAAAPHVSMSSVSLRIALHLRLHG